MDNFLVGILVICAALFFGISHMESIEKKDALIHQLEAQLQNQTGTQLATHEFYERQASVYMGCKQFFNLCSKETREIGEVRVQDGYLGTTNIYYWVGKFAFSFCLLAPLAISIAVFIAAINRLYLELIAPKQEEVERSQHLIDTEEERVAAARKETRAENLRRNEIQKEIGLLKKERHLAAHPPKQKVPPAVIPPVPPPPPHEDTPKNRNITPPKPQSEDFDDY